MVEEQNVQLKTMVNRLEESQAVVQEQVSVVDPAMEAEYGKPREVCLVGKGYTVK